VGVGGGYFPPPRGRKASLLARRSCGYGTKPPPTVASGLTPKGTKDYGGKSRGGERRGSKKIRPAGFPIVQRE